MGLTYPQLAGGLFAIVLLRHRACGWDGLAASSAQMKPRHPPLANLMARAEGYAEFAMRHLGQVPPTMIADSAKGPIHFLPSSLADERAKNHFANTARLICVAYEVTAAVMILESWMKVATPGQALDLTERPAEALDRQEVVFLVGEVAGEQRPKILPIIRTDAGTFFGFGEYRGPKVDDFKGRFAQLLPPKPAPAEVRQLAKSLLASMGLPEHVLRADLGMN